MPAEDNAIRPFRVSFPEAEARLNDLPNFITEIDGLDIHFLHIRSPHEDALDRGGHFAAWEQPDLFASELRASFRSLR